MFFQRGLEVLMCVCAGILLTLVGPLQRMAGQLSDVPAMSAPYDVQIHVLWFVPRADIELVPDRGLNWPWTRPREDFHVSFAWVVFFTLVGVALYMHFSFLTNSAVVRFFSMR